MKTKKVLIVDDQYAVRELLKAALKVYSLQEAANGQQALEIVEQWEPDLVIIDYKMPVLSGLETLSRIARMNLSKKPQTLLITACDEREIKNLSGLQVDEYICKPFDLIEFLGKVKALLEKHGDKI